MICLKLGIRAAPLFVVVERDFKDCHNEICAFWPWLAPTNQKRTPSLTMKFCRAAANLHPIEPRHAMAAFSRGLRSLTSVQTSDYICTRCLQFSTYSGLRSGHNRWSKIKHDKASVDAKKNRQRSIFSNELATVSKRESMPALGSSLYFFIK